MKYQIRLYFFAMLYITVDSRPKIMRNNALMTKMITHFQQDNNLSIDVPKTAMNQERTEQSRDRIEQKQNAQDTQDTQDTNNPQRPEKVLNLMQNVLCRNFPSIPCNVIMRDDALNKLIEKSIQQITYKKQQMDQTTVQPRDTHTKYPLIDSEDLSNFLEVSNTGFFNEKEATPSRQKKHSAHNPGKRKNHWPHEKSSKKKVKGKTDTKHGTELFTGRKKMRKFYPHKIKYKDKGPTNNRGEFRDYTEEKMSMSAEFPEMNLGIGQKAEHLAYKVEPSDAPVWRIDYMKHGVPSVSVGFEDDRLRGKIMKSGPPPQTIVAEDTRMEQPTVVRKEVLRPDVYIKQSVFRQKPNMNSDILD